MGCRILKISSSLFVQMFGAGRHDGYRVLNDALPPDTRLVNAKVDFPEFRNGGNLCLLLESEEWSDVPEDKRIPEIIPKLTRITLTAADGDASDG